MNRVHMGKRRVHFSPLVILEIKDPPEKNRSVLSTKQIINSKNDLGIISQHLYDDFIIPNKVKFDQHYL